MAILPIGHETQVQDYCKTDKEAGALLKNAVDARWASPRGRMDEY